MLRKQGSSFLGDKMQVRLDRSAEPLLKAQQKRVVFRLDFVDVVRQIGQDDVLRTSDAVVALRRFNPPTVWARKETCWLAKHKHAQQSAQKAGHMANTTEPSKPPQSGFENLVSMWNP